MENYQIPAVIVDIFREQELQRVSSLAPKRSSYSSKYEPDSSLVQIGKFRATSDGFIVVYTDGSCLQNGRENPRAGVGVFFGPESNNNVSTLLSDKFEHTNNNAEIVAVITALHLCRNQGYTSIEIRSDSKFLLVAITEYMPIWKANGWCKTNKKPVKNKEVLEELLLSLQGLTVRWIYVPAHVNNSGNNFADFLARWSTFDKTGSQVARIVGPSSRSKIRK